MLVGLLLQLSLDLSQLGHLAAQLAQFVLKSLRPGGQVGGLCTVRGVQGLQVAVNALLDLLHPLLELVRREVAVAVVDRLELAAVHGDDAVDEQLELAADGHKLAAGLADAAAVVAAEIGDGLEVRGQTPRQPHQLDIALALALQAPAALHAVEVAVDVDLQQHARVVAGPASRGRHHPFETNAGEVQLIHERINDANRVVLAYEVIQALRQQRDLLSILALDVSRHTGSCARYGREL
jgi:hypothetical protein